MAATCEAMRPPIDLPPIAIRFLGCFFLASSNAATHRASRTSVLSGIFLPRVT